MQVYVTHSHQFTESHRFQHAGAFAADRCRDHERTIRAYMGGLVKELKDKPIIINGIADHVHMLILLPPNVSISDGMRFIKANSSRWLKEQFGIKFAWQKGFGAFSVSRSNVDVVTKYIRDQEQHHKGFDFKREFVSMLDKNNIDYDERDLWG